jgi:hypothetical protein
MLEAGLSSGVRTTIEVFDEVRERHFVEPFVHAKCFVAIHSYHTIALNLLQEITFNKNMMVARYTACFLKPMYGNGCNDRYHVSFTDQACSLRVRKNFVGIFFFSQIPISCA